MSQSPELTLHYDLSFKKTREEAFAYLRDISRRREFMTIVDETVITKKTRGSNLKGTLFKETTHFLGFDMHLGYEISDFEEGSVIGVRCSDGPFFPYMCITLADGKGKTCTGSVTVSLHLGALSHMPSFLIKPTIETIIKKILKKLTDCINKE